MKTVFEVMFYTGVLYALVSFVLGEIFHFADFHMHMDLDGDMSSFSVSPIKPITIAGFVTVFGGIGLMCLKLGKGTIFAVLVAAASALVASSLIYFLVVVPLYKAQNTSAPSKKDLIGLTAKVTSCIAQNGFGKISYSINGNIYNAPAKHINKSFIDSGEEVIIIAIEKNVFYVDLIN